MVKLPYYTYNRVHIIPNTVILCIFSLDKMLKTCQKQAVTKKRLQNFIAKITLESDSKNATILKYTITNAKIKKNDK